MTTLEKLLALKITAPFDRLRDAELELIATAANDRRFPPGQVIHAGGAPLSRLYILIEGGWTGAAGARLPRTLGVGSLLFDLPVADTVTAATDTGALCLVISRHHFHTIAMECPELLLGFLAGSPEAPPP